MDSYGNAVYHNNFINNTSQVSSFDSINMWDDGYPSGGNYWSDYPGVDLYSGPYQNTSGSDEIGDTPYVLDENNQDRYPLMYIYSPLVGDLNGDGKIDITDIAQAALAFGSYPGHERWNSQADINHDRQVDILDIALVASNFGKTWIP